MAKSILKFYPLNILANHGLSYPTPINLSYLWNFGSLLGIALAIQLLTGIFLAMHYTTNIIIAFESIEHIMRDVNYGWLLRYTHANGASMFLLLLYMHIGRGLYFGSFDKPRHLIWISGALIFLLTMAVAFMGYVLPWGQMSFWGATVITNLFTAIPVVGKIIALWLWGGFSVGNATLNRFFSLHYLLPFVIIGLVFLHLVFLHKPGSSNPTKITQIPKIAFYPYFVLKDIFGFICFSIFFSFFVFFEPNMLGHPDNYIKANPMSTPAHIVPEWYFLPFYAILRSIPDKLGGVAFMGGSIAILFILPFMATSLVSTLKYRSFYSQITFWYFVVTVIALGWLGAKPVEDPYLTLGIIFNVLYFLYFLVILPCLTFLDHPFEIGQLNNLQHLPGDLAKKLFGLPLDEDNSHIKVLTDEDIKNAGNIQVSLDENQKVDTRYKLSNKSI